MMRIAALALATLLTAPLPAAFADDNPLVGSQWTGTGEAVSERLSKTPCAPPISC
jgi:hypothetical protein